MLTATDSILPPVNLADSTPNPSTSTAEVSQEDPTAPLAQAGPALCAMQDLEPATQSDHPSEAGKDPARPRRNYTIAEKLEAVAIIENGGTFEDLASKFPVLKKGKFREWLAIKDILREEPDKTKKRVSTSQVKRAARKLQSHFVDDKTRQRESPTAASRQISDTPPVPVQLVAVQPAIVGPTAEPATPPILPTSTSGSMQPVQQSSAAPDASVSRIFASLAPQLPVPNIQPHICAHPNGAALEYDKDLLGASTSAAPSRFPHSPESLRGPKLTVAALPPPPPVAMDRPVPAQPPNSPAGGTKTKIPAASASSLTSPDSEIIGKLTQVLVKYPHLLPGVSAVVQAVSVSDRVSKVLELETLLQQRPGALEDSEVSDIFKRLCLSLKPNTAVGNPPLALPHTQSAPAEVAADKTSRQSLRQRSPPALFPSPPTQDAPAEDDESAQVQLAAADGGEITRETPPCLPVLASPQRARPSGKVAHVEADDGKSVKRKLTELKDNDKTTYAIGPVSPVVPKAKRAKPSVKKSSPQKKTSTADMEKKATPRASSPSAKQLSPQETITGPHPVPEERGFPSPALIFKAQVAAMCVTRAGIEALIERMGGRQPVNKFKPRPARRPEAARASLDPPSIIGLLDDSGRGHAVSAKVERYGAEFGVFYQAQVPAWNPKHFLDVKERKAGEFLSQWSAYVERKGES
ncbi:hypothetical protein HDU87_007417 [Geranomyces variabilis]|uniref:Uncharacterized protein n=1 Tax=Geranomyces variabilis TaxID=109894 RepID=A0AAD5TRH7_9FUNG|nr:hypothetical protein HDU87_007417 [Geranomyces variabilis]